jgi:hypothetical protein
VDLEMNRIYGYVTILLCGFMLSQHIFKLSESYEFREAQTEPSYRSDVRPIAFGMPDSPLRYCGTPCVINLSDGGYNSDFEVAALIINYWPQQRLIINGPCYSSCTILADLSKNKTCITHNAEFHYHKGNSGAGEFIGYGYSKFALRWVHDHGGFPSYVSGRTLRMDYGDASQHWRTCDALDWQRIRLRNFPKWVDETYDNTRLALLQTSYDWLNWDAVRPPRARAWFTPSVNYSALYFCGPCVEVALRDILSIQGK